jgi:protein-disulfide isomerase
MAMMTKLFAVLGSAGLVSLGCTTSRSGAVTAKTTSAQTAPETVAAELQDAKVTVGELDERIKGQLRQLNQQQYDLRRQVLDQMLGELLLKREASDRKISVDELVRTEVDARVPAPTQAELEVFYARVKNQVNGQPLEAVRPRLEDFLRQRARERRLAEFRRELTKKQSAKVLLTPPRFELSIPASAPALGPAGAPITIVEYTDYQCPFCQRAQETVDVMLERYGSKVRLVHRDYPLDMHPHARPAAAAAHCAGDQGRFWEYRRSLLMQAGDLGDADLHSRAASLKLDTATFQACLASQRHDDEVQKSLVEGQALGVNGTPTFFINGRFVTGAPSVEAFADVIEDELNRPKS